MMLKRLRIQLSFLYLLAAAGLVLLIGGGSYLLLRYYLQATTDLALEYKMAQQFHSYGLVLPGELQRAERTWLENNARLARGGTGLATLFPTPKSSHANEEEGEEGEDGEYRPSVRAAGRRVRNRRGGLRWRFSCHIRFLPGCQWKYHFRFSGI